MEVERLVAYFDGDVASLEKAGRKALRIVDNLEKRLANAEKSFSKTFNNLGSSSGASKVNTPFSKIDREMRKAQTDIKRMNRERIRDERRLTTQIGREAKQRSSRKTREARRAANETIKLIRKVEREERRVTARGSGIGSSVKKGAFLGSIAGSLGASAISTTIDLAQRGARAWLDYSSALEQSAIGFETLLGSEEAAKTHIKDLQDFAKTTNFSFAGIAKASQQLQGVGVDIKEVIPLMGALGNATAAAGRSQDDLRRAVRAFGDIQSKGVLQQQEVIQLTNAGIPLHKLLAELYGKETAEIQQMQKAGALTAEVVFEGFKRISEQKFGDAAEKQSHTFAGSMEKIKDSVLIASNTAFKPLYEEISKLSDQAAKDIDAQGDDFVGIGKTIGEYLVAGITSTVEYGITSLIRSQLDRQTELNQMLQEGRYVDWAKATASDTVGWTSPATKTVVSGIYKGIDKDRAYSNLTTSGLTQPSSSSDEEYVSPGALYASPTSGKKISLADRLTSNKGKSRTDSGFKLHKDAQIVFKRFSKIMETQPQFLPKLDKIAKSLNTRPEWILNVMAFESRLRGSAKNPTSSATGLIQFMDNKRKGDGIYEYGGKRLRRNQLAGMSETDQLDLVESYFKPFANRLNSQGAVYGAVAAGQVGVDSTSFFKKGSREYNANKVWDANKDGSITQGELGGLASQFGFGSGYNVGGLERIDPDAERKSQIRGLQNQYSSFGSTLSRKSQTTEREFAPLFAKETGTGDSQIASISRFYKQIGDAEDSAYKSRLANISSREKEIKSLVSISETERAEDLSRLNNERLKIDEDYKQRQFNIYNQQASAIKEVFLRDIENLQRDTTRDQIDSETALFGMDLSNVQRTENEFINKKSHIENPITQLKKLLELPSVKRSALETAKLQNVLEEANQKLLDLDSDKNLALKKSRKADLDNYREYVESVSQFTSESFNSQQEAAEATIDLMRNLGTERNVIREAELALEQAAEDTRHRITITRLEAERDALLKHRDSEGHRLEITTEFNKQIEAEMTRHNASIDNINLSLGKRSFGDDLRLGLQRAASQLPSFRDEAVATLTDIPQSMADVFSNTFSAMATQGESFWGGFKKSAFTALSEIANYYLKMGLVKLFTSIGTSLAGGFGGGGGDGGGGIMDAFGGKPYAEGGLVPARNGGHFINVGEGGHDEVVLTTDPSKRERQRHIFGKYIKRLNYDFFPPKADGDFLSNDFSVPSASNFINNAVAGTKGLNNGKTENHYHLDINIPVNAGPGGKLAPKSSRQVSEAAFEGVSRALEHTKQ